MTLNPEYDKTALILLPRTPARSTVEDLLLSTSRPFLIEEIRRRGVDVAVARGSNSFNEANGTMEPVLRPEYSPDRKSVTVHDIGKTGLENFGVVRNISGPIRTDIQTPFLNPNSIRDFGHNKHRMLSEVLQPASMHDRTSLLLDGELTPSDIADNVSSIPGDLLVAKPNGGQLSRGILVGSKQHITEQLVAMLTDESTLPEPYIIEEMLDFSAELPSLRGMNTKEQDRLNHANHTGVNKELRKYYFGNDTWDAAVHVTQVGETDFRNDDWLYVDLESIPERIMAGGAEVVKLLREKTGTDEFNIAIDWVYAGSPSHPEPSWQAMEVNVALPYLIGLDKHAEVGRRQQSKLAEQISRIATRPIA